jgi:ER-derived vesicles protein
MTSRIHLARPASGGGYQPDPHGFANTRPSSGYRAANPDDPLEKLRAFARTVEDNIDIYTQPLKPHLPAIGRFLIVVTFLEDSLRIVSQWGDQLWYLQRFVLLPLCWLFWYSHDFIRFCLDTGTSPGESHISS